MKTSTNSYPNNNFKQKKSQTKSTNKHAKQTFELFYKFYARVAKDFALDELSEGGVYLAGGIIQKKPKLLKKTIHKRIHIQPNILTNAQKNANPRNQKRQHQPPRNHKLHLKKQLITTSYIHSLEPKNI